MIFVGAPQEIEDGLASIVPKGRMGQPPEIATAALFLASDDCSTRYRHRAIRRRRYSAGLIETTNLTLGILLLIILQSNSNLVPVYAGVPNSENLSQKVDYIH